MAAGGIGWKDTTNQVITVKSDDIRQFRWSRGYQAGGWQLAVYCSHQSAQSDGLSFHGFEFAAKEQLRLFISEHYPSTEFVEFQQSLDGVNWGEVSVDEDGRMVVFSSCQDDEKDIFTIQCHAIQNCAISGRNELLLEFGHNAVGNGQVVDLKFHVPGKTTLDDEVVDENPDSERNEEKEMEMELLKDQVDICTVLCDQIKQHIGNVKDQNDHDTLISFSDLPCSVPRGRYDVECREQGLRLKGRSYDHNIPFSSILRLFLLPKADDYHVLFVIQMDPPLRHGQTRYPFLVFSFPKDELLEVEASGEKAVEKGLQLKYDGPTWEVFSSVIRLLANQKLTTPPPSQSTCFVRCTNKANEGHLYLLDKALLFLPKPIFIPYSDISSVIFLRSGAGLGNPRSFDIKVISRNGQIQFSSIPKEDLTDTRSLLESKNIKVANEQEPVINKKKRPLDEGSDGAMSGGSEEEDSTDEEYDEDGGVSDGEDSDDPEEEYDEDYESDTQSDAAAEKSETEEEEGKLIESYWSNYN